MAGGQVSQLPVFAVAGRDYSWSEVVRAAEWSGDWSDVVRTAEDSAAAALAAENRGLVASQPPLRPLVDRYTREFRRARRLLSADELRSWLVRRGVSVAAWRRWLVGVALRQSVVTDNDVAGDGSTLPAADMEEAVWVEAMCSGVLDRVARDLAVRVAVAAAQMADAASPSAAANVLDFDDLERQFADFAARVARATNVVDEVERHRLDWLSFEVEQLTGADLHVVSEAALCIQLDGREFAAVAAEANLPCTATRIDLESAEPQLRPHLLPARAGDLLGPLPMRGQHVLMRVLHRQAADARDPCIQRRALSTALQRAVDTEVANRVTWCEQHQ